jgi:beta-galactosidase
MARARHHDHIPQGADHYGYGGDFGEEVHGGNFVTDGLVDADRNPRPGLLDFKKVIEPLRITVADDWSGFIVRNGQDFADISAYSFRYVVEADGGTLDAGTVEVAPVSPQDEAVVQLPHSVPSLLAGLPEDRAAVLTVSAVLAADAAWAPAGQEVAWGQSVRAGASPAVTSQVEPVRVEDISPRLGSVLFSRITGRATSIGGVPVEKLALTLWWPSTDNDLGREGALLTSVRSPPSGQTPGWTCSMPGCSESAPRPRRRAGR